MKSIQYWHMQIHPDHKSFAEENIYSILEHKKIIGLGNWERGKNVIDRFRNEMNVNDVVAIKNGQKLVALVEIIGGWYEVKNDESEDTGWIENRRPIRVLDWELEDKNLPHTKGTLTRCTNDVPTTQIIKEWHSRVMESFEKRKLGIWGLEA